MRPSACAVRCAALLAASLVLSGPAGAAGVSYEFRPQPQDARAWLAAQGFAFELDAGNPARSRFALDDRGLTIETLGPAEPLITRSNIAVPQPARLALTWGVNRYPTGANWDVGANNEAIMVMISFGTQKYSGGLFVPASPYFIGFFLCERGRRGIPIKGRSYTMQGRYICIDGPAPGRELTSVIALDETFHVAFPSMPLLPVTGLAIEADTTQVNARSSAWIKSLKITSIP